MTNSNLITQLNKAQLLKKLKKYYKNIEVEKLLVTNDDGALTGLITVKDILKKQNFPDAAIDKHGRLLVGAAVGIDTNTQRE